MAAELLDTLPRPGVSGGRPRVIELFDQMRAHNEFKFHLLAGPRVSSGVTRKSSTPGCLRGRLGGGQRLLGVELEHGRGTI